MNGRGGRRLVAASLLAYLSLWAGCSNPANELELRGDGGTSGPGDGGGGQDDPDARQRGCGDGRQTAPEGCDDDNRQAGDGCSDTCQVEQGWDCSLSACVAAQCGDDVVAGAEQCDDGGRLSGDGCSFRCTLEPGFVCVTPGSPCRPAKCGDSAIEAQEQCDDGNEAAGDGCDARCQLELGHACDVPGSPCRTTTCGDNIVEGAEQCEDGEPGAGGCDDDCQLVPGYVCPQAGQPCRTTECGDGVTEGGEACDDGNDQDGDGCSASCEQEPFFRCEGSPSQCVPMQFVAISEFPAPMAQPQAVHYDPATRSFVAYGFSPGQGYQEVCLDGTLVDPATRYRPRDKVGDRLDGATYDPFTDRFLFIEQDGDLTEIDSTSGEVARTAKLTGLGTAGGLAVGDDGLLYACNHFSEVIRVYERFGTDPIRTIAAPTDGPYLDNLYTIPGEGMLGYYNRPPGAADQQFTFHHYDGSLVGRSSLPGPMFANGRAFPANSDGGEGAADGGFFLVCSEYLSNGGEDNGFCQLFSRRCTTDKECADRNPGTACNREAEIPYCYSPAKARNDQYTVALNSQNNLLLVHGNDTASDSVCTGAPVRIVALSEGDRGGTLTISDDETHVNYTPAPDFCGEVETFEYTSDLAGLQDSAVVNVLVACECGDSIQQANEECDDGNLVPDDGCDENCQLETACGNDRVDRGEECDDGNLDPGDGCGPTCTVELL